MVGASHGNLARVNELVLAHPALANAAWDWGFGDWETAIGAASHVGNKQIAAVPAIVTGGCASSGPGTPQELASPGCANVAPGGENREKFARRRKAGPMRSGD
jgi:hypothetical protein